MMNVIGVWDAETNINKMWNKVAEGVKRVAKEWLMTVGVVRAKANIIVG